MDHTMTKDECARRAMEAARLAKQVLKPGDRVRVSKCPGNKRHITFDGWDGQWIVSKTGINDYHPVNVDQVNGEHVSFRPTPKFGQLWNYDGKAFFICQNFWSVGESLWIADWASGKAEYATTEALSFREDYLDVNEDLMLDKFISWSRSGDADAMWFLAWWYEGKNHPKSVWYYIAAMRANPKKHAWVFDRLYSDAHSAFICKGVPKPDLDFLKEIPEFTEKKLYPGLWKHALDNAENAIHKARKHQGQANQHHGIVDTSRVKIIMSSKKLDN